MKAIISTLLVLSSLTGSAFASPAPVYKDVTISVSEVFVPDGFTPQSDAYVVVSGMFPNSCYTWKTAVVTNLSPLVHEIQSIAKVSQEMCAMIMIPFQRQVPLGHLVSGTHTLRFVNGDGTFSEKPLIVQ